MPLPFIVGISIGAGTAVVGFLKGGFAATRIKKAKTRYAERREAYDSFIVEFGNKQKGVSTQFEDLGKTRLEALVSLGKAVEFLEKAKLKKRDIIQECEIPTQKLIEWKKASVHAVEVLSGLVSSTASGAATAASAYGLVGILASASTGTAISTLSGAAAMNATLAWLGGGTLASGGGGVAAGTMVLGGLVAGPAIMVVGFVASWKASQVERKVEQFISEIDIDEENKRKLMAGLEVVAKRIEEVHKSTLEMEAELKKALQGNPNNMTDAYMVAKIAKSLGDLLEIAIIDRQGRIILEDR